MVYVGRVRREGVRQIGAITTIKCICLYTVVHFSVFEDTNKPFMIYEEQFSLASEH